MRCGEKSECRTEWLRAGGQWRVLARPPPSDTPPEVLDDTLHVGSTSRQHEGNKIPLGVILMTHLRARPAEQPMSLLGFWEHLKGTFWQKHVINGRGVIDQMGENNKSKPECPCLISLLFLFFLSSLVIPFFLLLCPCKDHAPLFSEEAKLKGFREAVQLLLERNVKARPMSMLEVTCNMGMLLCLMAEWQKVANKIKM